MGKNITKYLFLGLLLLTLSGLGFLIGQDFFQGKAEVRRTAENDPTPIQFYWNISQSVAPTEVSLPSNVDVDGLKIFYHTTLGIYPYFERDCTREQINDDVCKPQNGGVPQNVNLDAHKTKIKQQLDAIADNYNGYVVIDYEHWYPDWERARSIGKETSRQLVKSQPGRNGWTNDQIEAEAKRQYELAAKAYLLDTMSAVRAAWPGAKVGYWSRITEDPAENSRISWLWEASDALFPSIYILRPLGTTQEERSQNLAPYKKVLSEAKKYAGDKPILAYTWDRHGRVILPDCPGDRPSVCRQIMSAEDYAEYPKLAQEAGIDKIVLWSGVSASNPDTRQEFKDYFASVMGPIIRSYSTAPEVASACLQIKLGNRQSNQHNIKNIYIEVTSSSGEKLASVTNESSNSAGKITITDTALIDALKKTEARTIRIRPNGYLLARINNNSNISSGCYVVPDSQTFTPGDFNGDNRISISDLITAIRAHNGFVDSQTQVVLDVYAGAKPTLGQLVALIKNYNQTPNGE